MDITACAVNCRRDSGQHEYTNCERTGEPKDPRVDRRGQQISRSRGGNQVTKRANQPERREQAQDGTRYRQERRLGQELADQSRTRGAKRYANTQLLLAAGCMGEQQVGYIGANNQKNYSG